jgi:hypothetical protein
MSNTKKKGALSMYHQVKVFSVALLAMLVSVGVANAQLSLATNGDFALGNTNWGFAGVGAGPTFPVSGGNPAEHATLDQTAGGWGGVLFSDNGAGDPIAGDTLASLGVTAGSSYDFVMDTNDLGGNGASAGLKIEFWDAIGLISATSDGPAPTTPGWSLYSRTESIPLGTLRIKFVPLMVGQPTGSSVGFDNVGVVIPEPATLSLCALGMVGIITRRRRR